MPCHILSNIFNLPQIEMHCKRVGDLYPLLCSGWFLEIKREYHTYERDTSCHQEGHGKRMAYVCQIPPPSNGPRACPIPKKTVMKPSPAGAKRGPT